MVQQTPSGPTGPTGPTGAAPTWVAATLITTAIAVVIAAGVVTVLATRQATERAGSRPGSSADAGPGPDTGPDTGPGDRTPSGSPGHGSGSPAGPAQHVEVAGEQWTWTFTYQGTDPADTSDDVTDAGTLRDPADLYLIEGRPVEFALTSKDVLHSFFIPAFVFKKDVYPGRTTKASLTPDKRGTFAGKCAELCGRFHTKMVFRVHVVSEREYAARLAKLPKAGR